MYILEQYQTMCIIHWNVEVRLVFRLSPYPHGQSIYTQSQRKKKKNHINEYVKAKLGNERSLRQTKNVILSTLPPPPPIS